MLALDQERLEEIIARTLSDRDDRETLQRARIYLSKILQHSFLLPLPETIQPFTRRLLMASGISHAAESRTASPKDALQGGPPLRILLEESFGLEKGQFPEMIVEELDRSLPHNPRKTKAFLSSWILYLQLLVERSDEPLDWRLTVVLNYLAQFEEPIFRVIERSPERYNTELLRFCETGDWTLPVFEGIEWRGTPPSEQLSEETGELERRMSSPKTNQQRPWRTRWLHVDELILEMGEQPVPKLRSHLLGSALLRKV